MPAEAVGIVGLRSGAKIRILGSLSADEPAMPRTAAVHLLPRVEHQDELRKTPLVSIWSVYAADWRGLFAPVFNGARLSGSLIFAAE